MSPRRVSKSFSRAQNRDALSQADGSARGFTLLELLVVLTIIGMLSAVALPQLSTLADRVQYALDREVFERTLATLPYRAFKDRQDFVIAPEQDDGVVASPEPLVFPIQSALPNGTLETKSVSGPILAQPAPLFLPAGWKLELKAPIVYRSTGFCGGGRIVVRVGRTPFEYNLAPPTCLPQQE